MSYLGIWCPSTSCPSLPLRVELWGSPCTKGHSAFGEAFPLPRLLYSLFLSLSSFPSPSSVHPNKICYCLKEIKHRIRDITQISRTHAMHAGGPKFNSHHCWASHTLPELTIKNLPTNSPSALLRVAPYKRKQIKINIKHNHNNFASFLNLKLNKIKN